MTTTTFLLGVVRINVINLLSSTPTERQVDLHLSLTKTRDFALRFWELALARRLLPGPPPFVSIYATAGINTTTITRATGPRTRRTPAVDRPDSHLHSLIGSICASRRHSSFHLCLPGWPRLAQVGQGRPLIRSCPYGHLRGHNMTCIETCGPNRGRMSKAYLSPGKFPDRDAVSSWLVADNASDIQYTGRVSS